MTTTDPPLGAEVASLANEIVELGAEFQGACDASRAGKLTGQEGFVTVQHVMAELSRLYSALYPVRELARQHWADETRPRQVAG